MPTATASPRNYYEVLNVSPHASLDDIRRAFKRQVIEAHPDKNPERRDWSERRVRELIQAYEIIGKADSRERFDREYRAYSRIRRKRGLQRPFFFDRTDPGSRALLILHHLGRQESDRAVDLVWEMETRLGGRFLEDYLDRSDYLDCLFLLAEHHVLRRQFREAFNRLREFYLEDRDAVNRRHYFDQVVDRLKDLYLRKLPPVVASQEIPRLMREVEGLGLTKAEEKLRLRRLAEAHVDSGNLQAARSVIGVLRSTFPKAKEIEKIESLLSRRERSA